MGRWQAARRWTAALVAGAVAAGLGGCAVRFSKRSPWDIQEIQALSEQLEQYRNLAQLKSDEADQLRAAQALLEKRLASEIDSKDVSVGFDERGLVVRVLDRVLFDSGKAKLRHEAFSVLDKVARVLNQDVAGQPIGVEGHTDNQPIKVSSWKDNHQLSLARAKSVVDYLVNERGVDNSRITPVGHGQTRPIASNDTPEGRRMNRRVEIVVLPRGTKPEPSSAESADQSLYTK